MIHENFQRRENHAKSLKFGDAASNVHRYMLNVSMYSCALVSHTTLYTFVNQVTCAQAQRYLFNFEF